MSNAKESTQRTLLVAFLLCLVCSVLVAGVAITLRPKQIENRQLDTQRSIVKIAGLERPNMTAQEVTALFESRITPRLVELENGKFSDAFNAASYNGVAAAKDPALSRELSAAEDIATIRRLERYATVYIVSNEQGGLETIVLPIRGYGLWGTMYGFMALANDFNTVVGLGFNAHSETPGLGGEIDNPRWRAQWPGKKAFAEGDATVALSVIKGAGSVDPIHKVDALAGATLTSKGVNNLVHFWLGEHGFGPLIANLRAGEM